MPWGLRRVWETIYLLAKLMYLQPHIIGTWWRRVQGYFCSDQIAESTKKTGGGLSSARLLDLQSKECRECEELVDSFSLAKLL